MPSLAGVDVLVIDDEPDTRESIAMVLEQVGARVKTVTSVREGLDAADRARPDVILCDLGMPTEDGYVFIERLRARPHSPPTAALTAYAREEDRRAVIAAGFDAHLTKPVEPAELVSAVAALAAAAETARRVERRFLSGR
jgi:CheY-like chemotaxis protein